MYVTWDAVSLPERSLAHLFAGALQPASQLTPKFMALCHSHILLHMSAGALRPHVLRYILGSACKLDASLIHVACSVCPLKLLQAMRHLQIQAAHVNKMRYEANITYCRDVGWAFTKQDQLAVT